MFTASLKSSGRAPSPGSGGAQRCRDRRRVGARTPRGRGRSAGRDHRERHRDELPGSPGNLIQVRLGELNGRPGADPVGPGPRQRRDRSGTGSMVTELSGVGASAAARPNAGRTTQPPHRRTRRSCVEHAYGHRVEARRRSCARRRCLSVDGPLRAPSGRSAARPRRRRLSRRRHAVVGATRPTARSASLRNLPSSSSIDVIRSHGSPTPRPTLTPPWRTTSRS